MRAVDTNVLVRLLTGDDPKQYEAANEFVNQGAWISHLVLMETVWVLDSVYEVKRSRLAEAIEMLLNHTVLIVQDADTVAAALRYYKKSSRLGFSDCLIVEVARKAGHLPVGTFDHELGKIEGAQRL